MQGINLGDVVQLEYRWKSSFGQHYLDKKFRNQVVGFVQELSYTKITLQGCNPKGYPPCSKSSSYKLGDIFLCEKLNHESMLRLTGNLPEEKSSESTDNQPPKKIRLKNVNAGDIIGLQLMLNESHLGIKFSGFRNQCLGFVVGLNVNKISLANYNPQNTPPPGRRTSTYLLDTIVAYHVLKKEDFSAPAADDSSKEDFPILHPETVAR